MATFTFYCLLPAIWKVSEFWKVFGLYIIWNYFDHIEEIWDYSEEDLRSEGAVWSLSELKVKGNPKPLLFGLPFFFSGYSLLNTYLIRYYLCTIKFISFNCTIQWLLVNLQSWVIISTIRYFSIFVTPERFSWNHMGYELWSSGSFVTFTCGIWITWECSFNLVRCSCLYQ